MARWPAPGRCKRRLAVGIGSRCAAAVQARLTAHALAAARETRQRAGLASAAELPELVLAVDGLAGRGARRWGRALGAERVRLQGGGALGVRLRRQVQRARLEGAWAVVIVQWDSVMEILLQRLLHKETVAALAAAKVAQAAVELVQ
jgi:glycosyltransferase A (GT-A) superfamily protein (DUF2064 family)